MTEPEPARAPPGKAIQATVFVAMLPVYLPVLLILCAWNVAKRLLPV